MQEYTNDPEVTQILYRDEVTSSPSVSEAAEQHLLAFNTARIHVAEAKAPVADAARSLSFRIYVANLGDVDSPARLFEALARAMSFPSEFGKNWDALLDYIGDLFWDPAPGYLLVIENSTRLFEASPEDFLRLINITAQAAADWARDRVPFHVLVTGNERVAEAIVRARFTLARPDQYPLLTIATVCDERDKES